MHGSLEGGDGEADLVCARSGAMFSRIEMLRSFVPLAEQRVELKYL